MRRTINILSADPRSHRIQLKIWLNTGENFEESFTSQGTTFADVKLFAIQQSHYRTSCPTAEASSQNPFSSDNDQIDQYKLISIESKRAVEEEKKLSESNVKDGDEYLLVSKRNVPSRTGASTNEAEKNSKVEKADVLTIENRTRDLPVCLRTLNLRQRVALRNEFRTDLNRILVSLIETSQKLLWYHSDAEQIFRHAEELILRSSSSTEMNDSATSHSSEVLDDSTRASRVKKLIDMGFTERQARLGLKRTKYDLHAAMELLLTDTNLDDDDDAENEEPSSMSNNGRMPLFSRNGPFISFRKFQEERFQLNPSAVRSLKEMGFEQDQIVMALRMFNNNKSLACEYLLAGENQQKTMRDGRTEQTLDPNSRMFQAIVQNPVVQRTLNSPKTFFILLQLTENPGLISNYMNDPDIAQMLVEISRIYHAEKENFEPTLNQSSSEGNSASSTAHGASRHSDDDSTNSDSD